MRQSQKANAKDKKQTTIPRQDKTITNKPRQDQRRTREDKHKSAHLSS